MLRLLIVAASALIVVLANAASALAAAGFIRVDQLGYAPGAPKRAYLMSTGPAPGEQYTVQSSNGTVVFAAPLGPSLGAWSPRFPDVYALDFDAVRSPGQYAITVTGPLSASSSAFSIESPSSLYATALDNARAFYDDERDGPGFIRSALRSGAGHLNDRHARAYVPPRTDGDGVFNGDLTALPATIDASGGWWDAGDYLKFVETTSYAVDLMLTGVRDFPNEMGARAGRSDFSGEAKFGLSWLLRMWNDRTRTLYFQVGIGEGNAQTVGDHDLWRLPQADDGYGGNDRRYRYIRHRPVFRAGPPGSPISPNLAGRDAAAFALCFQVFRRSDRPLAVRCLRSAEHIYDLANTHPGRLLTTVPYDFYPETEWRDDLELGAVELADALAAGSPPRGLPHSSANYYLRQAARWARAYASHSGDSAAPVNLYDVSGLADYELYRALSRPHAPSHLAVTRASLLGDLGAGLADAGAQADRDPFGFGYPWDASDTAAQAAGLSLLASEYASLTGDGASRALSVRWLDNLLGTNPWGESLVIGDGTQFPHCPQHQVANLAGSLSGTGPVLAGAVVEGPTAAATSGEVDGMRSCSGAGNSLSLFDGPAVFKDDVQSYSTVEPAIDLTAASPLAFAWQIQAGS